jgi:hypothetical protein
MACKACKIREAIYAKFQSCNVEYCAICVPPRFLALLDNVESLENGKSYYINVSKNVWRLSESKKQLIKNFSRVYTVVASGICCWKHYYIHLYESDVSIIVEWGAENALKTECVFLHKNLKDKILYLRIHVVSYDVQVALYGTIYNLAKKHITKYFKDNLTDDPLTICEIHL